MKKEETAHWFEMREIKQQYEGEMLKERRKWSEKERSLLLREMDP